MKTKTTETLHPGYRLSVQEGNVEVAHAYLYVLKNDLHSNPFGFLEDVFVKDDMRGQGVGSELVKKIIEIAKNKGCYKLIATSRVERPKIHRLYQALGFKDYGKEFRMDL